MKSDSPLFDKIRVKPDKDRRVKNDGPVCEWHGCKEKATNKAPKGPGNDKVYWNYCLKHAREYNQSYNFFAGMNDAAGAGIPERRPDRPSSDLENGHRQAESPSRPGCARPRRRSLRPVRRRHENRAEKQTEQRQIRNAERKALDRLGLDVGATPAQVKIRFKELVKQFHPDANGGDRSTEDRLVEVIQSYNYLKSAGFG